MYTGCIHKVLLDDPQRFNNPITLQFTFEVRIHHSLCGQ